MSTDHTSPPLPPEPETPAWLTGVGAVLFLAAGVWWLTSISADQRRAGEAAAALDAGAPAAVAPSAVASARAHP